MPSRLPDSAILSALFNRATQTETEPTTQGPENVNAINFTIGIAVGLTGGVLVIVAITALIVGAIYRKRLQIKRKKYVS